MFDFFNTRKIAALESQIAALAEKLEKIESVADVKALEEKIDNYIDNRVEVEVENAIDRYDFSHAIEEATGNIDFEDIARDAIDEVVGRATLRVSF